ncbi:MAG TPA: hypothetical protein VHI55_05805 [Gaiellaceae bacterium]|nr:hypothetical protein [Gaiellaceae bacterium]
MIIESGDDVGNQLAAVTDRLHSLLDGMEHGEKPAREHVEATLTDGYACALSLDAECRRLETNISDNAAHLAEEGSQERALELSALAHLLARRRQERDSLRDLLAVLQTGVREARVA